MDSQTQARFLNHILKFFTFPSNDEDATAGATKDSDGPADCQGGLSGQVTTSSSTSRVAADTGAPDVPELLCLLRAAGFFIQYTDKSEFWGSSAGCRVVITCKHSGTRVVMDSEGPCTCPPEEAMKALLDNTRPGQAASRAPSPTPSTCALLEDSALNQTGKQDEAVPGLVRQRTFSRDRDDGILKEIAGTAGAVVAPENRRLSAPPAPTQSTWTTFQGDELNVLAATDLLQEAISLLSGVKKVNLRNTPVGPVRRLSAMASGPRPNRRASSDAFAMPLRPMSRTSSTSSGLASIMSSASSAQSGQTDTPRPTKLTAPRQNTTTGLRRTMSAVSTSSSARPKQASDKKGVAAESKFSSKFVPRMPSLLKAPSIGIGSRASTGSPQKVGSRTKL